MGPSRPRSRISYHDTDVSLDTQAHAQPLVAQHLRSRAQPRHAAPMRYPSPSSPHDPSTNKPPASSSASTAPPHWATQPPSSLPYTGHSHRAPHNPSTSTTRATSYASPYTGPSCSSAASTWSSHCGRASSSGAIGKSYGLCRHCLPQWARWKG